MKRAPAPVQWEVKAFKPRQTQPDSGLGVLEFSARRQGVPTVWRVAVQWGAWRKGVFFQARVTAVRLRFLPAFWACFVKGKKRARQAVAEHPV
jgi:hypothetical protein